jgi:exodeoxyribonuclease-5
LPKISEILKQKFPYEPTSDQKALFLLFDQILFTNGPDTLLIKGYAGTGKTSIVSVLVNILPLFNFKYMLLAPTGRAAKVLTTYSGRKAFTIHKIIYKLVQDKKTGELLFKKVRNYHKNTIFFIDEASMIYDDQQFGRSGLLKDLKDFVFEDPSNKIVFIGDTAQLPPVGQEYSGALDKENLELRYHLKVSDHELKEVVRQEQKSGILINATSVRNKIKEENVEVKLNTKTFRDVFKMQGDKMEDGLRYAFRKYGIEDSLIICQTNKQANMYNQFVRRNILFFDDEIDAGDYLMIVKNNYYWLDEDSTAGFLANGDFAEVLKISNTDQRFGFNFADLQLRLIDYPGHPHIQAKVILNTLHATTPSLTPEDNQQLYEQVAGQFAGISKKEFKQAMSEDPYLNALQVKFKYAITCHKSQGGQWSVVFLDQGFLREDMIDISYLRWLYTGMTRATKELYLVNFHDDLFT